MTTIKPSDIPVIILAGGQSLRLRKEIAVNVATDNNNNETLKWQLPFGDSNLLAEVIRAITPQTSQVIINGPKEYFNDLQKYALPIIYDQLPDYQGPLSGLLTSLLWAKLCGKPLVATIVCDSPFIPEDLIARLSASLNESQQKSMAAEKPLAAIATSNQQKHPVFGLWSSELYEVLNEHLVQGGTRSIMDWSKTIATTVDFANSSIGNKTLDPFFNINTEEDYQQALSIQKLLSQN